jgi:hypothetical protein
MVFQSSGAVSNEGIFECNHVLFPAHRESLVLEDDYGERQELHYFKDDNVDKVIVYVMNEHGQTIDKHKVKKTS